MAQPEERRAPGEIWDPVRERARARSPRRPPPGSSPRRASPPRSRREAPGCRLPGPPPRAYRTRAPRTARWEAPRTELVLRATSAAVCQRATELESSVPWTLTRCSMRSSRIQSPTSARRGPSPTRASRTSRLRPATKEIDFSASNGSLTETRLPTQTTSREVGGSERAARASALDIRRVVVGDAPHQDRAPPSIRAELDGPIDDRT